jgi:hypothetical protein
LVSRKEGKKEGLKGIRLFEVSGVSFVELKHSNEILGWQWSSAPSEGSKHKHWTTEARIIKGLPGRNQ